MNIVVNESCLFYLSEKLTDQEEPGDPTVASLVEANFHDTETYIFEVRCLDLRVQVYPFEDLVPRHTLRFYLM